MSLIVPNSVEVAVLTALLTPDLTIKLYSNDYTPVGASTVAAFIEISGGGYASKPLTFGNWSIAAGDPTQANYGSAQSWIFTGPTDAPGSIYGYYVIKNSDNSLQWAERFPSAVIPFAPVLGSKVIVLPRFSAQSLF